MKSSHLTPTKLRLILATGLVLTITGAGVIFALASSQLKTVATTVSHKVADAQASQNNLTNLRKIERFLEDHQATVTRANDIVAESKSYEYQNQIVNDLKSYAASAGISITDFNFTSANSAAPTTPAAPAAGGTTTPATETAAPAAPSLKSTSVTVTLASPVRYDNLLRFIKAIEQNLTKMQISTVSLSKGTTDSEVTTDTLAIEVYIR
ncbi:MAG TPA: hypothetical protein VF281_01820 [Candidatus Saccharimonadales bacterium]